MSHTLLKLGCLLGLLAPCWPAHAQKAAPPPPAPIEALTPPRPVRPPGLDEEESEEARNLRTKRRERRRRQKNLEPPAESPAQRREAGLRRDAETPRPRWLMMEVSTLLVSPVATGRKSGYTADPTSHFNVFFRKGAKAADDRTGLWYGGRLAPFAGSGFYRDKPGVYGLTYFGPMIGVGRLASPAGSRDAQTGEQGDVPSSDGYVANFGLALVNRLGRSDSTNPGERGNDFGSKGVGLDVPGLWVEIRYLKVLFGGLGVNAIAGVQTGTDKAFFYGGVGLAGWH